MPIKKAAKKTDIKKTTKAVVKPKKAPVVEKTPAAEALKEQVAKAVASKPTDKPTENKKLHGGIRFLYIPSKK